MSLDGAARKPPWLRVRIPAGSENTDVMNVLGKYGLNTVCRNALCPNMGECFGNKTATFMIMGRICTRNCGYCGVSGGTPPPLERDEPERVGKAVKELGLDYVVLTSVTRDDVGSEGASFFARTVEAVKRESPEIRVEVLIPDFMGDEKAIMEIVRSQPFVLGHNIEVAKRLFPKVRPEGDYDRSIQVLAFARKHCTTKSGFMVGLGETREEILETMKDLSGVADILTIGQYLQPTSEHLPLDRYYEPEEFEELRELGEGMGFRHVESGPLVRSSYHAGEYGDCK